MLILIYLNVCFNATYTWNFISTRLRFHLFLLVLSLTSTWNKHCVALSLDVLLVALSWQGHSALAGMKLAVYLGAGPRQHLTGTRAEHKS